MENNKCKEGGENEMEKEKPHIRKFLRESLWNE